MKILFYSDNTPTTFIHSQVQQISSQFDILYCSLADQKPEWSDKYRYLKIDRFENKVISRGRNFLELHDWYMDFRNRTFRKSFREILRNFQPDIVHCQFGYDALRVFDNAFDPELQYIVHFRGYDASNKLASKRYCKKLNHMLSNSNVWAVCVCEHLKRNLINHGIEFKNEPEIVHSNTDIDLFQRHGGNVRKNFTFIQVSSFRKKKGHEQTIRAFALFLSRQSDRKTFLLQFTGFDENDHRCQEARTLCHELQIAEHVEFLPWVSSDEARNLLERASVAVQHSVTTWDGDQEGIPNFLMEAMSMELPVISTWHGGIPELVNPQGAIAQLVKEGDVEAYAGAMKLAYDEWRLAPENREKVVAEFSKKLFLSKIGSVYQSSTSGT